MARTASKVSRKASSRPVERATRATRRDAAIATEICDDDWLDFRPGVLCGGKLSAAEVAARSKGATEACLSALKKSRTYSAWERGEDLAAPPMGLAALLRKALVVLLVVVLAVSTSVYREHASQTTVAMDRVEIPSSVVVEEPTVAPTPTPVSTTSPSTPTADDVDVDVDVGVDVGVGVGFDVEESMLPPPAIQLELQQRLEDLELEVKLERARATKAKDKEDSMFNALEQSTHKVHELSRDLRTAQAQAELLEDKLRLSGRHSEVVESVDRSLLALECLLVLSSIVGYVRAHQIRSAMIKARRSFVMAYRRQQRVLASADEVYASAMKYSAEVEASDVGPRAVSVAESQPELKPWDPLLDDLESLVKTSLPDRLDRGATPVQVLQALAAHFAELRAATNEMQGRMEESRRALESSLTKVKSLEGEVDAANQAAAQRALALQAESAKAEHLSASLASVEAKASGLEDKVRATSEEKTMLSEELLKAKEELEKVTAYATSLEDAGFAAAAAASASASAVAGTTGRDYSDVRGHLNGFTAAMDVAVGRTGDNVDDDLDDSNDSDDDDDDDDDVMNDGALLGERLQRIKELIQEANDSPFELLSPNTDLYEGTDAGTALRNLPVIGTMNISSSDSDDEDFNARQDADVQRMLDTSALLSSQVSEYVDILRDDDAVEGGAPGMSGVVSDLQKKRDAVDVQRKRVEALVRASQKEARSRRALKVKRKEVDFLSEREEITHGQDELKASDRLFLARKMERDGMVELRKGQSALREALEQARAIVRQQAS
jgi:hypothetical protein